MLTEEGAKLRVHSANICRELRGLRPYIEKITLQQFVKKIWNKRSIKVNRIQSVPINFVKYN